MLKAALNALNAAGITITAASKIITSQPIGPSHRQYANGAALIECADDPLELLELLQAIEAQFGRQRGGQRWVARVLDLDIVLWEHGAWASPGLTIPHPEFRHRGFVLGPAAQIAARWRDPMTYLSLKQLNARLTKANALPIGPFP